jgi:hypothetical protein
MNCDWEKDLHALMDSLRLFIIYYLLFILVAVISGLHYFGTVTWALLFCLISLSHRRIQHRPLILMFSYLSIFICIYINSITQSCSLDVWFN